MNCLPQDLQFVVFNFLPVTQLQKFPVPPDHYWEVRIGTKLNSPYLFKLEKYLQVNNLEVGYGSHKHLPIERCILLAIKANNWNLVQYFLEVGNVCITDLNLASIEILRTNSLECIKGLHSLGFKFDIEYSKDINPQIYEFLFTLPNIKEYYIDRKVIAKFLPLDIVEHIYKEQEVSPEDPWISDHPAANFDLERYWDLDKILKFNWDPSPYILDQADNVDKLNPLYMIQFGSINLLKKWDWNQSRSLSNYFEAVPEVPLDRAKQMYDYLTQLSQTITDKSDLGLIYFGLEYWHWLLYKKSRNYIITSNRSKRIYKQLISTYKSILDYYIQRSGDRELIYNWVTTQNEIEPPDLLNYPELCPDTIGIRKFDFQNIPDYLKRHFTAQLYLAIYQILQPDDQISYLPNYQMAERYLQNLEVQFAPNFKEPYLYWKNKGGTIRQRDFQFSCSPWTLSNHD